MSSIKGKVALITGANRGIGRAIAELFAREGAVVAGAARNVELLEEVCSGIRTSGGKATAYQLDLRDEKSIKSVIEKVQDDLGPIDILINNAGVIHLKTITDTPTDILDEIMDINLRGVFITCREVLPSMMERRSGRIINLGSLAGRTGYVEQAAYCASKHAMVGFTRVLAMEAQAFGVRVHLLSPGGVRTEMTTELRAFRNEPEDSPDWMTAEEVAEAALYLCGQEGAGVTDEIVLRRFKSAPWR